VTVAIRVPGEPLAAPGENAGLATRVIAFAADAIVIDVVVWLVGGIVAVTASALGVTQVVQTLLLAGGAVIALLWASGYFVFFWATTGQTPGDRIMRIRVRRAAEDRPLSVRRSIVRFVGAILAALPFFLGYAMILFDAQRRGLHDRMAHSVVVYVPREPRVTRSG
jgi:uncharacterized RDD family membrane protein YckC